ncbi:efflux transporter outer membrane subunit [Candidatus Methylobacter oryzae]|uniref:Efflux transporter outer membrane subunit n=2 Tax=Candidatus Methylobacter oryzae TaxID=2497749 RepID=A0ABY3C638_9GAMM|nr:efflux transporter outer membrane subunit [Candidatus Methylobacter oryzae]TRW90317.1 efflux transporter outer membrane subunit [Candidatus Methylobacter oryzae]
MAFGYKIGYLWLLCALAGCTMGPDYRPSTPIVPERWQAEQGNGLDLKPISPEKLKSWWRSFGDARLNRLMDLALAGNLDLKIALARVDQARADRRSIRAELFPQVGVKAGAQRNLNLSPIYSRGLSFNIFELGFDALWEVDLFGRQQRRLEAASADLDAAHEEQAQALVTLTAELARAYVEYRNVQNQLRITGSNLQTQQHTLKLTERLFNEGVGSRHDVVRARALVEDTEAQIPALEAQMIAALRQLEMLVGKQPGALAADLEETGAVPVAPGRELLASPAMTIRHRPDLAIAERRLAAATAMHGAAVAELFPKISLSAFLGLRNTDIESLFKSAAFSYSTTSNLMQPLLNFGRIRAGIDLAEAKQNEAYLAYEKAVLEALRDTETALTRYLKEEVRRQILGKSVEDQRESVRLSELRYREGVISFLDVLDAQRAQYAAEIELARSEAEASTNLIAFYKTLGGGADAALPEVVQKAL